MASEAGYDRQITPRATTPLPDATPAQYGAGFGAAMEGAAQTVNRAALQTYQVQREETQDQQWTDFQHRFAQHREAMDQAALAARDNAAPGAAGHTAAIKQQLTDARDPLLSGITEKKVLDRASGMVDEYDVGLLNREGDWQDVKRAGKVIDDHVQATDIAANRARRLTDYKDFAQEIDISSKAVDGLALSDDQKAKLKREDAQKITIAFLQGTMDRDPQLAQGMLDKGVFDEVLDPKQVDELRSGAQVEIRRADAEAEHQAAVQKADFHQTLQLVREADQQGIDVSSQLPGLRDRATQLGLPADALQIDGMAANAKYARIYGDAPPVQREQRMATLAAKPKPSIDDQRELKWLQDHQGGLDASFNTDPAGWAAKHAGTGAPPPLDFTDPKSIAARSQWARAATQAYGRPVPPFTANEAAQLRENYTNGGRAGAIQTMDLLGQLPPDQAAAGARMVAPEQKTLAIMVTLPRDVRSLALDGREALKGNSKLLKFEDQRDTDMAKRYDAALGEALRGVPPDTLSAVNAVAGEIMAGQISRTGKPITPELYWQGINQALGAQGSGVNRKGGLGSWGDHFFLLPDGVTPHAWGTAVLRESVQGPVKPINPDGSPANLKRTHPVMVAPGRYQFVDDGGAVVKSNGVMGYPLVAHPDRSTWDKRADGSRKGMGWLGLLQRPDGNVSSEISVGVEIGGKEREIPLMVPGLAQPELDYLMTHDPGSPDFQRKMPRSILAKAEAFAKTRLAQGKSPFRGDGEPSVQPSPWTVTVTAK